MNNFKALLGAFVFLLSLTAFSNDANAQKIRLRSQLTPACTGSANSRFADVYADGNIAVLGSYSCKGAFIFDISDPDHPSLASWYNPGNSQQFLEAIVIGNRGYFGSGNSGGVHIVDLTDPANPVLLGIVDQNNGNGHRSIHEMMVFQQNGATLLLENYNSTSVKTLKVINVSDPANPVFIRNFDPTEVQWVHAMHIRGNRLFTSGWGNNSTRGKTEIYDIENIATRPPVLLGSISDPSASPTAGNNMHSSWTSEDGRYLYSAREVTNSNGPSPGDIRVYDIADPAQPLLVNRISMADLGINAVTPHNPVVKGNKLYVSWYQAGLQVFDLTDPTTPVRIGQYDTFEDAYTPSDATTIADQPWDQICGPGLSQSNLPTNYDGLWAVYPFLGEDKVVIGDLTKGLLIVDVSDFNAPQRNTISDFDGDGKTDLSVFTPASGQWTVENSSTGTPQYSIFGLNGDQIVTADYDGDGRSDVSVWRPSNGVWYVLGSTSGFYQVQFGLAGDVPVVGDYDADGKDDIGVWRPSTGVWYVNRSTLGIQIVKWGIAGDKPLVGDYEGDGKADMAIWRPSTGVWYVLPSSAEIPVIVKFGVETDKPVALDINGDARTDFGIYRPSTGQWYTLTSSNYTLGVYQFGLAEDMPIPADFDGDGTSDIAVYRPSGNVWYALRSSDNGVMIRQFGQAGDEPSPSSVQPN
jgi:hypothetical protein